MGGSVSMIDGHIDEVLKPCPFCGSKNVIAEINNLDKEFIIFCENDCCRAEMRLPFADTMVGNGEFISFYEMQKIMDDLTDAWNRRAGNG